MSHDTAFIFGFSVIVGILWGIYKQVQAVSEKLTELIGIAHRIRINDRQRDF